ARPRGATRRAAAAPRAGRRRGSQGPPVTILYGGLRVGPRSRHRNRLFGTARVIVGRSGYSTLMDVAQVRARALIVPMRGQTEQEYLAARLARKGLVHAVAERDVDLSRDVPLAGLRRGLDGVVRRGADGAARAVEEILVDPPDLARTRTHVYPPRYRGFVTRSFS